MAGTVLVISVALIAAILPSVSRPTVTRLDPIGATPRMLVPVTVTASTSPCPAAWAQAAEAQNNAMAAVPEVRIALLVKIRISLSPHRGCVLLRSLLRTKTRDARRIPTAMFELFSRKPNLIAADVGTQI